MPDQGNSLKRSFIVPVSVEPSPVKLAFKSVVVDEAGHYHCVYRPCFQESENFVSVRFAKDRHSRKSWGDHDRGPIGGLFCVCSLVYLRVSHFFSSVRVK